MSGVEREVLPTSAHCGGDRGCVERLLEVMIGESSVAADLSSLPMRERNAGHTAVDVLGPPTSCDGLEAAEAGVA